jgi:hypothetical protein
MSSSLDERPTEELRADRRRYLAELSRLLDSNPRHMLDVNQLRHLIKRIDAILEHR